MKATPRSIRVVVSLLAAAVVSNEQPAAGKELIQELPVSGQVEFEQRLVVGSPGSREDTNTIHVEFSFDLFDTNLGALDAVSVGYSTSFSPDVDASIIALSTAGMNVNMECQHLLSPPGATTPITRRRVFNKSGTFRDKPPVVTELHINFGTKSVDSGLVDLPGSAVQLYAGTGQVVIPMDVSCVQEATISNTGMWFNFGTGYQITARLRYSYIPFEITDFQLTEDGLARITWNAKPGIDYQIEGAERLREPNWVTLTNITAEGTSPNVVVPANGNGQRFYRISTDAR